MYPRTVADASSLQEVSEAELRSLKATRGDIVCLDGASKIRIRWCSSPTAPGTSFRVLKSGLVGWCSVISAEGTDVPTEPVRIHFCSTFPCCATFDGLGALPPRYHVKALGLMARDCPCEEACIAEGVSTSSTSKAPALPALAEPTVPALPAPAEPLPKPISLIAELAGEWAPSFRYVGLFAFLIWGIQNEKEVRVWLWKDQYVDLVATYAPWAHGADNSVADWPCVQVVACKIKQVGNSERASACMVQGPSTFFEINHYMPLVSAPGGRRTLKPQHPPCNGVLCNKRGDYCISELITQTLLFGAIPFRSVADGNCSFDTMLFHTGKVRSELTRKSMRSDIIGQMHNVAGNCNWEEACLTLEGRSATVAEGVCSASTPTESALSAPVEPQPKVLVIPVISEPVAHKMPLYPQPEPKPVLVLAEDLPALLSDDEPEPALVLADVLADDHADPGAPPELLSDDEDEDPPALAEHDEQPELEAAIMKKMGLLRMNTWETATLVKNLAPALKASIIADGKAEMSSGEGSMAAKPLQVAKERKDHRVGTKRKHSEMIAAHAAKHGVDGTAKRVPSGFWKTFAEECNSKDQFHQGDMNRKQKMYWRRRLRAAVRSSDTLLAAKRWRCNGAGAHVKMPCIEEELVLWFAGVRRSGGRVA